MRIEAYSQIQNLYQTSSTQKSTQSKGGVSFMDSLNLSGTGKEIQTAKDAVKAAPDIRADKVAAIKEAYKNGTYNVSAEDFADRIIEKYSDKGEIRF